MSTDLSQALHDLIERFEGRVRYTTRSPNGVPKLMSVVFGPRTYPSHRLEIQDYHRQEDPLQREERMRAENDKLHDKRRREVQAAVREALAQQRKELAEEWGIAPQSDGPALPRRSSRADGERWSKRSFTDAIAEALTDGALSACEQEREGSNVLYLQDGDQRFKITISMPRQKK